MMGVSERDKGPHEGGAGGQREGEVEGKGPTIPVGSTRHLHARLVLLAKASHKSCPAISSSSAILISQRPLFQAAAGGSYRAK